MCGFCALENTSNGKSEIDQVKKSLKDMYELGVEHGRKLAEKDLEIKQLKQDIGKLAPTQKPKPKSKEQK